MFLRVVREVQVLDVGVLVGRAERSALSPDAVGISGTLGRVIYTDNCLSAAFSIHIHTAPLSVLGEDRFTTE